MTFEEVQALVTLHRAELASLGVRSLGVFGSVARGDATAASDVDVLVEFDGRATFDRYMGLVLALQSWLGRRVDVVTARSLERKPAFREQVLTEVRRVA
ncbi:MAG: nucleotidyltransferase family protein [Deltaproteobacteria bacterium]|nr:nucleotidyltransferase family protein [Deltaproteobacteria bacterium]